MLTKFETKSNRVKGLSFHTKRPWILASLHSGVIQLWDYRMGTLIDRFDEHDGPVRGVHFHMSQPLFVSGGLDFFSLPPQFYLCFVNLVGKDQSNLYPNCPEDKSIRVWDATKRTGLQTFRREHDRFWILAAHPEINLLAAGHDSGMIVFKLERERPAFAVSGDSLFYAKDRFLRYYDFSTQKETQIVPIRRAGSTTLNQCPRTLSYSPTENAVLICSDVDGGTYELYQIPKDSIGRSDLQEAKRGPGSSAIFVARNRFAVLDKSNNQVLIKNLKNEVVRKSGLPVPTDAIFYAGTGNLLCRSDDRVVVFDLQQRLVLGDLQTPFVKYVVWSSDMESVALLSKHSIIITSKKLVHQCTFHETIRVKSGAWDENGVFIYTTLNHIKYCLPNGDSGIIRTLDVPIYLTKVSGNKIFCLDRDGKNKTLVIDKRYDPCYDHDRNPQLCRWRPVIAYLHRRGSPASCSPFLVQKMRNRRSALLILIRLKYKNDVMGQFHNALEWLCVLCVCVVKILIWSFWNGVQNGDVTDGEVAEDNEEGGWDLEDLELPPEVETPRVNARSSVFVAPTPGMPVSQIWTQRSSLAADHAAAGNFDTAMRLLSRQLGIRNFTPLKSMFLDLHTGSHSYLRAFSSAPVVSLAVERGWSESASPNVRGPPALVFNFSQLDEKLKAGYKATTDGKFTEALRLFLNILHTIPLIVVESRREVDEVKELIIIAKEYVLGLQMELKRRELKDNPVRQQELAAYFTHCNLQMPHLRLALRNAMTICFKAKNLATAANFARRLLETNPNENHSKAARQVLQASERNMTDASQLNYDFRNPFVTCGATYVPIYRGQKDVSCPYCTTRFVPTQEGQLCTICDLAVIGADASGLLCSPSQIR
ncbi:hypothetical protein GOBAR_AA14693 [Gossypium barbadense]|uniref:Uncharacterized protein n=1 Tax=Gossypium barbadense TaxID=3634 RepID=A0A2P5XRL2_GOSBA|nr:hypothetical protein GOBAR_AA14693 [Gossypium barbadense]